MAEIEHDGESPLLSLLSAVNADDLDQGVAAHYVAPFPEQRALDAGEAFTDLSNRDVVELHGPDRLKLLLHLYLTLFLTSTQAAYLFYPKASLNEFFLYLQ